MSKPVPINLVPHAALIDGAREFLRGWAKDDGPITCFINPVPIGADPFVFGTALVDIVRQGARAWAQATGIPVADAEARIWEGLDAERVSAASSPRAAAPPADDGFITYTRPGELN